MKKLFKEFKAFITKGNVMDLAVGMIIGSAFTAIVTALVNSILKPLINWIPVSTTGLQTVLRPAVIDETGKVVTEALILDWGAVISAVITFLVTAVVLFSLIKVFNKVKAVAETTAQKTKEGAEKLLGKKTAEENTESTQEVPAAEAVVEAAPAEKTSTELLLEEIRDLLKAKAEPTDTTDTESDNK